MTTNNFIAVFIGKMGGDFFMQLQKYNLENINYLAIDFDQEKIFNAKFKSISDAFILLSYSESE